jgi:phosphatidylinositol phospholipase C epsilon
MGSPNQEEGVGGEGAVATIKRRMFFLIIYGVQNVGTGSQSTPSRNEEEPYVILKVTQDCTSETVIRKALSKLPPSTSASTPVHLQLHDYLLLEEVNRGWEPSDRLLPPLQRILDPQERPLEAQAKWRGEGRFILRRIGDDPSSRAWLSSILNSNQKMKLRKVYFFSFFLNLILSCLTCING